MQDFQALLESFQRKIMPVHIPMQRLYTFLQHVLVFCHAVALDSAAANAVILATYYAIVYTECNSLQQILCVQRTGVILVRRNKNKGTTINKGEG